MVGRIRLIWVSGHGLCMIICIWNGIRLYSKWLDAEKKSVLSSLAYSLPWGSSLPWSARHSHFMKIIDSIRLRLVGWKKNFVSFTGRLILVKYVLSSIPMHIALVTPLLSRTCLLIERLMRNFLWFADPIKSRSNYVRWETICQPKSEGGLGLRRLKGINDACLLKLGKTAVKDSSLWANWFRARYRRNNSIWHPSNPKNGSTIWK